MSQGCTQGASLDIQLLTFKNWNLPHTTSVCSANDAYGEYVSFQNYHFVDIQPVEKIESSRQFCAVYDRLEKIGKHKTQSLFLWIFIQSRA